MTLIQILITLSLTVSSTNSFSPISIGKQNTNRKIETSHRVRNYGSALSMSAISDAQALLAKARALREQAESDEHKLHSTLIEKKQCKDVETDTVIQNLFPLTDGNLDEEEAKIALAKRMNEQKLSTNALKKVVERLHEREISARGLEHVEPSSSHHNEKVQFVRVAELQQDDLDRVQGLIQRLIDAAEILDEEYLNHGEKHHHVDATHWSKGSLSKVLKEKAHFLGREHDEEFKKRLADYYEAARKKKDYESYSM